MEAILGRLLQPDNEVIKAATGDLRAAFKQPGVISELCGVLGSSQQVQIRQYAAVLLRWSRSGLPHPDVQLDLYLAVITDTRHVLGTHQVLDKVGRQVDAVQPGLGNMGAPVEGVLTHPRVEVAKAVNIVHIRH
eukprot:GFUD01046315.1.p2 GENE.GFUD01046315.1~~GFUD01046315.1.p2  ORF type:complete len:134 (+),score=42.95 GFUD01046315.1:37-438(+)